MHISEGVLNAPVLATGWAVTAAGVSVGLAKLDSERVVRAGVLSAAFFMASLIHVPLGPSSVHLILNGVVGLILGWAAFPAIFTALALQAVFFQFGGLTTLGANTMIMALPAIAVFLLFRKTVHAEKRGVRMAGSFAAGFLAVGLSGLLAAGTLAFTGEAFKEAAVLLLTFHLPVMAIEGIITAFVVEFFVKVDPGLLSA